MLKSVYEKLNDLPVDTHQAIADAHEGILIEMVNATKAHGPMVNRHEAYGIIAEEMEEFWELVRRKHPPKEAMREELTQIAAMCLRAIVDLKL